MTQQLLSYQIRFDQLTSCTKTVYILCHVFVRCDVLFLETDAQ